MRLRSGFLAWWFLVARNSNSYSIVGASASTSATPPNVCLEPSQSNDKVPFVDLPADAAWPLPFGPVSALPTKPVMACCKVNPDSGALERVEIGRIPQFSPDQAVAVLEDAVGKAWQGGAGAWPQMSLASRIQKVRQFLDDVLIGEREALIEALVWEIGKTRNDAASEVDRTHQFGLAVLNAVAEMAAENPHGSSKARIRRAALGVVLAVGPYNYPLNETYATLIPALVLGNVCLLKLPTIGGLVHLRTMEAAVRIFPAGTLQFVSGPGRTTLPAIMETGRVDALAFIGGSNAADKLIHAHPHPHRLKVFLQLEAKNMAIYLDSLWEEGKSDALEKALDETIKGTLSYNGQRCTALKLLMVPRKHTEAFQNALVQRVDALQVGLPSQQPKDSQNLDITPLPTPQRIQYMQELLEDAQAHGARILNAHGGTVVHGTADDDSTLMIPAVVYPVTPEMRLFTEEQFGPILPIVAYDDLETDVLHRAHTGMYGQQVSIFAPVSEKRVAGLVDRLALVYGKVNVQQSCGRSPDTLPFSGRRSSALGTMSVTHALEEFSIPVVVAVADSDHLREWEDQSTFLQVPELADAALKG